jgi:protein-tyrosine phosphatase
MKVLFVCLGNICRSPAAEGVLRSLAEKAGLSDQMEIMSCGIGDWHVGQLPDPRMRHAALQRGITLTSQGKVFFPHYLDEFDYILAADHEILEHLHRFATTPVQKARLHLMTAFSSAFKGKSIPDPYYNGAAAFDQILDMLEDACQGFIAEVKTKEKESPSS